MQLIIVHLLNVLIIGSMKIAPHFKYHNLTLINAKSTLFQKIQHSYYMHMNL